MVDGRILNKLIHIIAACIIMFAVSSAKATEAPLISSDQFNSEWNVHGFPDLLTTADGTPLFQLNVTVTLEWHINEQGELTTITVLEEVPARKGYADIVIDAMRKTRLEAKVDSPTVPARVRGTFEFRAL